MLSTSTVQHVSAIILDKHSGLHGPPKWSGFPDEASVVRGERHMTARVEAGATAVPSGGEWRKGGLSEHIYIYISVDVV